MGENSKEHRLVLLEWVDSGQAIPGWQFVGDLDKYEPHRCKSVGWLVQESDQVYVLAQSIGPDQVAALTTIPKVCVTMCKDVGPMLFAPEQNVAGAASAGSSYSSGQKRTLTQILGKDAGEKGAVSAAG